MTKKKNHEDDTQYYDDPEVHATVEPAADPEAPVEWVVMTDGAVFPKDKLVTLAADVPAPKEVEGSDTVVCHVGDIVSLTVAEAQAKRGSGVALAEVVPE